MTKDQSCCGCIYFPDFPSYERCQKCSRRYLDHYEDANQGKIITLQVFFTQFVVRDRKQHAICGGYFNTEFICHTSKLQNLHSLEFDIEELDEPSIIQLGIRNPDDMITLCTSQKNLTSHVAGANIRKYDWSLSYNTSMEYVQHMIEANKKE